jgi:ComF family protein
MRLSVRQHRHTLNCSDTVYQLKLKVRALTSLASLVWPARSLLSDQPVADPGTIEAPLWQALDRLAGPLCSRCGVPLPDSPVPEAECSACQAHNPPYRRHRAALAYDDLSRPLVLGLKHGGRREGLGFYATLMLDAAPFVREADLLVPVPVHWTRLAARGYNQAAWLAQALSKRTGIACLPDALTRIRATGSQNGRGWDSRHANVAGAIAAAAKARPRIKDRTVVLVDDVFTTGATIEACTQALLAAGAAAVEAVTLARVVRQRESTAWQQGSCDT